MNWDHITDIILYASFAVLVVFLTIGIYQLFTRKSFKKIDKALLWMPLPLILMVITYLLFDKVLPPITTRPNGSGEPSFPSTHVMVVATIFFLATMELPKYVKTKVARIILEILMVVLLSLVCVGRVISEMHSPIDVIAGLIFAFIFTEIYYWIIHPRKEKK